MKAELLLDARAQLGEGALWYNDRLLWIDIEGCALHRLDPVTLRDESWPLGQMVGTVVPRASGGLVVSLHRGLATFDPATGALEIFANPEGGRLEMRFNDGKCDPRGRLFVGSMGVNKPRPPGSLYRIDADRTVTKVISGTGVSNGLAWSHDARTMYFIDTPTLEVSAFDYDVETGAFANRRTAVSFAGGRGRPDGMTIDAEGNLWVALFDGAGVVGCDPRTGRLFERIEVAASRTTSCAFGGANLDELYITCARADGEPYSGGIFVARPGVRGVRAVAFAG